MPPPANQVHHPLSDIDTPSRDWRNDSGFLSYYNRDGSNDYHLGADLNIPYLPPQDGNVDAGQAVYTSFSGEIVLAGPVAGYGEALVQFVTVNNQEFTIVYGHVQPTVAVGSYLEGAEIGRLYDYDGSGPGVAHLHFAVAEGHTVSALRGYTDLATKNTSAVDAFGADYVDVSISGETVRFRDPIVFLHNHNYAAAEMAVGSAIGGGYIYDTVWFRFGELISSGLGDDTIHQGFDDDVIDGGNGIDTVIYNFGPSNYDIRAVGNTVLVEGPEGTDHLRNVEALRFLDNGIPIQTLDVTLLDGYGDLYIADLAATGNSYDFTMGNAWLTNANSTPAVATTTSDWGINDLVQGAQSLWDAFTSLWTVNVANAADGLEFAVFSSGTRTVAVETNTTALDFGPAGSLAIADLIDGEAPDDHTDTSSGAVTVGSGAITSFTSAQGSIESRSDVDVFEAQLQAGQEYSFLLWANTTQNSRLDPELTIRSPSGTVWRNDNLTNSTTMSFLSFVAPQSGTYVFEARGVGDSTGSYWLNITPINIDPTADNLTPSNEDLPGFEWNGSNGDWHGDDGNNSFPTPGWDPHKGDLDAANRLRGHDGDDRIEAGGGDDIVWGDDGEDRLYGEDGNDTIRGGRHDDTIYGGDGDDLIYGEHGDDLIYGDISISNGRGDDTIYGGDGDDRIYAGRGNDYVKGEDDDDYIRGGDGNDELYGDRGNDRLRGDDGDDQLFGGPGNDTLEGGDGRDRLAGEAGHDLLEGGDGDDALYGGTGDDTLQGGSGNDLLHGEEGTDTADFSDGRTGVIVNLFDEIAVSSDLGTDRLYDIENIIGSRGDDVIDGNHSQNVLRGGDGDDIIRGHNGNDTLYGEDDNDVVWGDEGDDYIYGGDGNDELRGGLGNDRLFGGAGDDYIRGEQGDDVIDGGAGIDTVFFWGEHDDFSIQLGVSGEVIVTDLRADGLEGRDTLTNVEYIEFFDGKALVSDLLANAPVSADDAITVEGDRPTLLDLMSNDTTNATTAHYSNVEIVSGGGSVSIIGGSIVFDPGEDFRSLTTAQTSAVQISYSITTAGFQTTSGTASLSVVGFAADIDLAIGGWNSGGTGFEEMAPGDTETIFLTLVNYGTDTSPAGDHISIILSSDQNVSSDDIALTDVTYGALVGGGQETVTGIPFTIPTDITPGTYNIGYVVDINDAVSETDEGNNVVWLDHSTEIVSPVGPPDVSASNLNVVMRTDGSGLFDAMFEVTNNGPDLPYGTAVALRLSEDQTIYWEGDYFLGSVGTGELASGETVQLEISGVDLDWIQNYGTFTPGTHYFAVEADYSDSLDEKDEQNNISNLVPVELELPSLTLTGGDGDETLTGGNGHDTIHAGAGSDLVYGGDGNDQIFAGSGADYLLGEAGNDTITLSGTTYHTAQFAAYNVSSATQTGTGQLINLAGKVKIEAVIDGGADFDSIDLSNQGDAFFLHDAYSGFHQSLALTADYVGNESTQRFINVQNINGLGGDDIIDLTSPDYSLAGETIRIDGGEGNDVIWGSDADETIYGGNGDDTIFGGTGTDVLFGGAGADVFQFTKTSTDTTVMDFDPTAGDTLQFFNRGGATFDPTSLALTETGVRIGYDEAGTRYEIDIALAASADEFSWSLSQILATTDFL